MMTQMALAISVGVLVNNAIVVLENIYVHLQRNEAPIDAAVRGTGEILVAVSGCTLTNVVVFTPIAFMTGMVGQFFTIRPDSTSPVVRTPGRVYRYPRWEAFSCRQDATAGQERIRQAWGQALWGSELITADSAKAFDHRWAKRPVSACSCLDLSHTPTSLEF
jgi:hypothetical protein